MTDWYTLVFEGLNVCIWYSE